MNLVLVLGTLFVLGVQATAPYGTGLYEGAGVVVTKFNVGLQQIEVVDNGAVVCRDSNADGTPDQGVGGVCIPFDALHRVTEDNASYNRSIQVVDAQFDTAFQVCVDNNGDNICIGQPDIENGVLHHPQDCNTDTIAYSHATTFGPPVFHNPLFIPRWVEQFYLSCGPQSGGFPGYVVMICAGVHDNELGTDPHVHAASNGFVHASTSAGDGLSGNYCGAPTASKAYVVV